MPTPTEYAIAELLLPDRSRRIVMQFATPSGVQFFFFDIAAAAKIGEAITRLAGTPSGIVVPRR